MPHFSWIKTDSGGEQVHPRVQKNPEREEEIMAAQHFNGADANSALEHIFLGGKSHV